MVKWRDSIRFGRPMSEASVRQFGSMVIAAFRHARNDRQQQRARTFF
jgi:hypothetical protein